MIGNWVKAKDGRPVKVYAVGEVFVSIDPHPDLSTKRIAVPIGSVSPIELTPVILEKAGFDYDLVTHGIANFWLAEGGGGRWDVWLNGLSSQKVTSIQYVHQLQNLYYAITGNPLSLEM